MKKTCTTCGKAKPLSEFYKQADCQYGVASRCKICTRAARIDHYQANTEKVLARNVRWQQANPDKVAAAKTKWKRANPEKIKAHYEANRDKVVAANTKWKRANPDKVKASGRKRYRTNPHRFWENSYRTRCRKLGLDPIIVSFTREKLIAKYGDRCFYCDDGAFEVLDHHLCVAAGGPHTLANVRPCCQACNIRKGLTTDRVDIAAFRKTRGDVDPFRTTG